MTSSCFWAAILVGLTASATWELYRALRDARSIRIRLTKGEGE